MVSAAPSGPAGTGGHRQRPTCGTQDQHLTLASLPRDHGDLVALACERTGPWGGVGVGEIQVVR